MRRRRLGQGVLVWVAAAAAALAVGSSATASHPQPAPDIGKMTYTPIGKYGPDGPGWVGAPSVDRSQTIPPTNAPQAPTAGRRYNPSGKYVAYDTDLFETLSLPYRAAGDASGGDPLGNGGNQPQHGRCNPLASPDPQGLAPLTLLAGRCPNHQLEYLAYFEETMRDILGPFGVTLKRYRFDSPGGGNTRSGSSYNVAAVVPGADHPEQTVIVSGHYDQTTEAPASGWDSAEGHAEVIRMAKIMADYWRATGTRPAATIKFAPWDQEESGTLGSIDYVENNVVPGEEDKVRGYFNVDPCAGGYPAFYRGNPADRVPLSLQLVNPDDHADDPEFVARVKRFNARALTVVDDVMNRLDDKLLSAPGQPNIFVSDQEASAGSPSQRAQIQTALGGLLLFTSDYANFEEIGVPFFNLGPAFFGPSADGTPNRQDGITILHTPNDNLQTINALTSVDQSGNLASEGWAKGMEFCAQLESWYMLQPQMAGGQTANANVVGYYEALPNEAIQRQPVTFDASGSYQYTNVGAGTTTSDLDYKWSFGDGTSATGKKVTHAYGEIGKYASKLTVTSKSNPQLKDTMTIPVTVIGSDFDPPVLRRPPATDSDGTFPLAWSFSATRSGFKRFDVEQATDFKRLLADDGEAGPTRQWNRNDPAEPSLEPWQRSDSSTRKLRGNQKRSGRRGFWTGVQPTAFQPVAVQSGVSMLTLKNPISVPRTGSPEFSYWSLFQSEGDDSGRVEVAKVGSTPGATLDWQPIDLIQATNTAVGGPGDKAVCDPTNPDTLSTGMEHRRASLAGFQGRRVLVRFVYRLGSENRAASQPCGWYVDDVGLTSGTFRKIGDSKRTRFTVSRRRRGTYAYRVLGLYNDDLPTAPSNVESVRVTRGPCVRPGRRPRGRRLGPARLGGSRRGHRRKLGTPRRKRRNFDLFCLTDRRRLRIGYPSKRLRRRLSRRSARRVRSKAVLILSTSRRHRLLGLRPGSRSRSLRRRLRGRRAMRLRVRGQVWYLARGKKSRLVFRVRRRRIYEVGIASKSLTSTRRRAKLFLRSF